MKEMKVVYSDGSVRSVCICTEPSELPKGISEDKLFDLKTNRAYSLQSVSSLQEEVQDELSKFTDSFI